MERRGATRVRSVLKAQIRYNSGLMSAPCLVRDISEGGARLELAGDVALPEQFDLYIEKRDQTYPAVVKRRNARDVSIAFQVPQQESGEESEKDLATRVSELEAEIAELRQVFAEMVSMASADALNRVSRKADTAAPTLRRAAH